MYEHGDDEVPYGVLTGDTLFVGDVGRPDLLATGDTELSSDTLARQLYHSLHDTLLTLPDATRVFPAHGAGSSCGKQLSQETSSTLGEQRKTNYALQLATKTRSSRRSPKASRCDPTTSRIDAQRNRELRPLLDDDAPPTLLIDDVLERRRLGAVLLDTRDPAEFAAGHVRGAINVGLQGRFAEWAGDVLEPDRDIVLVGDPSAAVESKVRLARVGYDRVVGQLEDPSAVVSSRPDVIETSSRLTIEQLAELRGSGAESAAGRRAESVRDRGRYVAGRTRGPVAGTDRLVPRARSDGPGRRLLRRRFPLAGRGECPRRPRFCRCVRPPRRLHVMERCWALDAASQRMPIRATPSVGARAAKVLVDGGALLLDVRELEEWQVERAPDALLMPMGQVKARVSELSPDRRVVVVCRSGGRSAAVTDALRAWGYDATNLAGGMCAWTAAGLPVVGGQPPASTTLDAGLVQHRAEPLNCETSIPALIGGVVMPNARFYVRNHFAAPALDPATWRLAVGGLVERPMTLSLPELQRMPSQTLVATLECAGNGRSTFDPPVEGEQWQLGAVSTAEWTGVLLSEVLDRTGPTSAACEVLLRGADQGTVEGAARPIHFERSLTLDDALDSGALLAYAMNGEPLPLQHGYPLRLIVPGWYAVTSVKWLTDIELIGYAVQRLLPNRPLRLRVGTRRRRRPRTGAPPASAFGHHRADRRHRVALGRSPRSWRRLVRRGTHLARRRPSRPRALATSAFGRGASIRELAVVGTTPARRRTRPDRARPRAPPISQVEPNPKPRHGTASATAATRSRS